MQGKDPQTSNDAGTIKSHGNAAHAKDQKDDQKLEK